MSWWEQAACKGMDTRIFFPEEHDQKGVKQALQICATCPVQQQCLFEAVTSDEYGVWGGHSWRKRRNLRRQLGLIAFRTLKPIRHGTPAGRNAHKRRGEPMCDPCREAYNRFHRDYQRSVKRQQQEQEAS